MKRYHPIFFVFLESYISLVISLHHVFKWLTLKFLFQNLRIGFLIRRPRVISSWKFCYYLCMAKYACGKPPAHWPHCVQSYTTLLYDIQRLWNEDTSVIIWLYLFSEIKGSMFQADSIASIFRKKDGVIWSWKCFCTISVQLKLKTIWAFSMWNVVLCILPCGI